MTSTQSPATWLASSAMACALALVLSLPAVAQAVPGERWKLASATLRPVAVVGDQLIARDGDEIVAITLATGKKRWGTRIGNLRRGPRALAAGPRGVYALGTTGLYVLSLSDGAIMHTEAFTRPREVLRVGHSVYVSHEKGVVQLDASGKKRLAATTTFHGALRGASGPYVVLFRDLSALRKKKKIRGSAKRLTVVNLAKNKRVYEFRLLPNGAHHVLRIDRSRLSFIDYSRNVAGKNSKKLFLTEADYRANKKLRDISLKHHYIDGRSDRFLGTATGPDTVVLVENGPASATSTVFALELQHQRVVWTHKAKRPFGAPLVVGSRVWLASGAKLIAYALSSGKILATVLLGASPQGPLLAGKGGALVVRDKTATRYILPGAAPPKAPGGPARPGWRLYRDKLAGYTIQLPKIWRLNTRHIRHFGKDAFAVPFVRYSVSSGRWRFVASIHVLVRPARGQNVEALWRAVIAQRRKRARGAKVLATRRRTRRGKAEIVGAYSFRNRFGSIEQARSLCIVSHGLAFELRARVRPNAAAKLWPEVERIFDSFAAKPGLRRRP